MRALEFRAWDTEAKCYIEEPILVDNFGNVYEVCEESSPVKGTCLITGKPNVILEQYTGVKDDNDKEIAEGDIVSEEFEYGGDKTKTIWQVRWCDDECAFELHYVSGFKVDDCSLVADDEEDYEVIGNIHELNMEELCQKE